MNIVSIDTRERLLKTFTVLTAVATILMLSGVAYLAPTALGATPSDYGLKEGDLISAAGSDDPDVYIVNEHGYKRLFLNPVIFGFYGHLGGFSAVKNVSPVVRDAFPTSGLFRNCEMNDPAVYALEVTGEDTGMLHWVNMSGQQAVSEDPNFFKKVFCINNNEFNWYWKGTDYTSLSQVPNYSRTPGQGQQQTGSLSATLASDNPASGTVVESQAMADLAHFQINGSGVVTTVELQRLGVSGDSTLANVYLFVNGYRVTDSGSFADGKVTFTNGQGIFTAPATLVVRSDIAASSAGQTLGVKLTKLNDSVVSVSGNVHNVAAAPSGLGVVTLTSPTGPGNVDPKNDVDVFRTTFSVSNKDVWLKRLTLREVGTVNYGDIKNFRLLLDGQQVASAPSLNSDGYVTFLPNYRMTTRNYDVKVVADVVGGSGRTFSFSLRGKYDLDLVETNYNVGIYATGVTFPATTATSNINAGSVVTQKATDSPSSDLVQGSTDVPLGRWTLTAYGEPIKVETLTVMATTSDSGFTSLRNGRILINGVQYGSTANVTTTPSSTGKEYTVNYTIQPGASVTVEFKADLKNANGTDLASGKWVKVTLKQGNSNAQKVTSGGAIDVPSSSEGNIAANQLNVVAGTISLSKFAGYPNRTVTVPQNNLKLGQFTLLGNANENVNVNTIDLEFVGTSNWTVSKLSNVYVKYGNNQTSPLSTVTASNSLSVSFTLNKNENMNVEVYGNVSSFTTGTMTTKMKFSGLTASSNQSVNTGEATGQTLTQGSGSISASVDTASNKLALGNSTVTGPTFRFTTVDDTFRITEMVFKVDSAAAAAALQLELSGVGTQPFVTVSSGSHYAKFTGLNIQVPANSDKSFVANVVTNSVGSGAADTGKNVGVTLTSWKYRDQDGAGTETTVDTDQVGANVYVHKNYPTLSSAMGTSYQLFNAQQEIAKFTINPQTSASAIGFKQFRLTITKSSAVNIASSSGDIRVYRGSEDITSLVAISHTNLGANQTSGTITVVLNSEDQFSTSQTYTVKVTVSGASSGNTLTAKIAEVNSQTAPTTFAAAQTASPHFVWTDRSASGHGVGTNDWMTGYLVPGLPLQWTGTYQ